MDIKKSPSCKATHYEIDKKESKDSRPIGSSPDERETRESILRWFTFQRHQFSHQSVRGIVRSERNFSKWEELFEVRGIVRFSRNKSWSVMKPKTESVEATLDSLSDVFALTEKTEELHHTKITLVRDVTMTSSVSGAKYVLKTCRPKDQTPETRFQLLQSIRKLMDNV